MDYFPRVKLRLRVKGRVKSSISAGIISSLPTHINPIKTHLAGVASSGLTMPLVSPTLLIALVSSKSISNPSPKGLHFKTRNQAKKRVDVHKVKSTPAVKRRSSFSEWESSSPGGSDVEFLLLCVNDFVIWPSFDFVIAKTLKTIP